MVLAAVLLASPAWVFSDETTAPSGSYGIELSIEPVEGEEAYLCTAMIRDLETSSVLSAPRIRAAAGDEAKTTTTFELGGVGYRLTLSVLVTDDLVEYRFEAVHGEKLAAVQSGRLRY